MTRLLPLAQALDVRRCGGKATALARCQAAGLPVPDSLRDGPPSWQPRGERGAGTHQLTHRLTGVVGLRLAQRCPRTKRMSQHRGGGHRDPSPEVHPLARSPARRGGRGRRVGSWLSVSCMGELLVGEGATREGVGDRAGVGVLAGVVGWLIAEGFPGGAWPP